MKEQPIFHVLVADDESNAETWGNQLLTLLDELDFSEWEAMDMPGVTNYSF